MENGIHRLKSEEKEKYSKCWNSKQYAQSAQSYAIADRILKEKPKGPVLDLGCGNGFAVRRLIDYGLNAHGVDITSSAWLNQSAVNPNFNVPLDKLTESPIWDLPYQDDVFDISFSTTLLEHIPTEMVDRCTKEIIRVTKHKTIHYIDTQKDSEHEGEHLHLTVQPVEWWQQKFHALNGKNLIVEVHDKRDLKESKGKFLNPLWALHKIAICIQERRLPDFLTSRK